MIASLTSKGQVTVPKDIRNRLHLRSGDKLDFVLRADGIVEVVPLKQPAGKLKGLLAKPKTPVTIEAMNRAIAEGAGRDDRD